MNTKEAAEKWDVSESTVKKYCQEGMVPFAEKDGRKWLIPDHAEKPLFTRHRAVQFMSYIDDCHEGGNPNLMRAGFTVEYINKAYFYLYDMGFITLPGRGRTLAEMLKNVRLTSKGKALIRDELTAMEKSHKTKIDGHLKFSLHHLIEAQFGFEKEL